MSCVFFSSRRRHTRYWRDWSSDVCSSDLVMGTKDICTVSYKGLAEDVTTGDTILIDDGLVGLRVEEVKGEEIHCVVENSGIVKNHKGVNVPRVKINLPALTEKEDRKSTRLNSSHANISYA